MYTKAQKKIIAKWVARAAELCVQGRNMPESWDCDVRRDILRKEMDADGLKLGKDYVIMYGYVCGGFHTCLELFGTNKKKVVCFFWKYTAINGVRIDPTFSANKTMYQLWKGEYQDVGKVC